MASFWFQGNNVYDALYANFENLVHEAGEERMSGPDWNDTVDGKVAQMILCDQFPRNIFRGTSKAFVYDSAAQKLARELASNLLKSATVLPGIPSAGPAKEGLDGEIFPPYTAFVIVT